MSGRNPLFAGRCYLCGHPAASLYCYGCDWYAGDFRAPDPVGPLTLTEFHTYWLERYTPEEIIQVAGGLES